MMDLHPHELLNSTVEIFGEVRLYEASTDNINTTLQSSHSLIQKLQNLQVNLEEEQGLPTRPASGTNDKSLHHAVKCKLQKEIETFKKKYKPIVQVHSIKHIRDAREIIAENLHFRQIQKYRKSRLGPKCI